MKHNVEQKTTKRYHSYPLTLLMAVVLFFICFNAYAQESMQFDSEAKKLEFIRQTLKKEEYLQPSDRSAPHCKQIMTDLLAGKNFTAIEPYVRADSIDDPRMAKWRQCEHAEGGPLPFAFVSMYDLGAPPYRWYRIELDGNPKDGLEDMIYYNQPSSGGLHATTGYSWVDLKECEIKDGFPVTGALTGRSSKPDAIYLNALVYYKGELWALDFVDGYGFSLMRWLDREHMETCRWWFF